MPRLTFHGAAQTVTGSKFLLETGSSRTLIDCGLFQGLKALRMLNWAPLPFEAAAIDSVVLTHAHLDHVGYLPRLVKQGFSGPVYCTSATAELTELTLLDSAEIQESDARYANRKGFSRHTPALPLYGVADARQSLKQLCTVERGHWHQAAGPIWFRFHDAGHLLGSNMIEVELRDVQPPRRLLFSGDIGRYGAPLYHDPAPPPACEYLICESTYGNRDHAAGNALDHLAEVVMAAVRRGGVMLVASFAVGRAQQLVYLLKVLIHLGRIPEMPIYLDSPMAVDATNIYLAHPADHDLSEAQFPDGRLFAGPKVQMARSSDESKEINHVTGPAVIIASSGMMTGGRILHHLRRRLSDERNTIVLGGFMAEGTRGRQLQEGAKFLRIHGQDIPVRAAIAVVSGLSGHAGRSELQRWLAPLDKPRRTFIVHGEVAGANALAESLRHERGWDVVLPKLGESFEL